jgi:hypothetical protein
MPMHEASSTGTMPMHQASSEPQSMQTAQIADTDRSSTMADVCLRNTWPEFQRALHSKPLSRTGTNSRAWCPKSKAASSRHPIVSR